MLKILNKKAKQIDEEIIESLSDSESEELLKLRSSLNKLRKFDGEYVLTTNGIMLCKECGEPLN